MNERNLIVGIAMDQNSAQVCYFKKDMSDAVSFEVQVGSGKVDFPVLLSWIPGTDEWYSGPEAEFFAREKNGILIDRLYDLVQHGNSVELEGRTFSAGELLARYLLRLLKLAGVQEVALQIEAVALSFPQLTRAAVQVIREALGKLGLPKGKTLLLDYKECFYYHTLYQKQELWARGAGLFSFRNDEVTWYKLGLNVRTRPVTVEVKEGSTITLNENTRDEQFAELIRSSIGDAFYSALFIAGAGFSQSWAKQSTALLCCKQRKVFGENALFAKGACFAAREKLYDQLLKGYLYVGEDMVRTNIGMDMQIKGTPAYYPLVNAGVSWYETGKECEFLLDDTDELVFQVSNMDTGKKTRYSMKLDGLPERPGRTTRIRLKAAYDSVGCCKIEAWDLGFGDLFPSSGLKWMENLED